MAVKQAAAPRGLTCRRRLPSYEPWQAARGRHDADIRAEYEASQAERGQPLKAMAGDDDELPF